jgi:hypothetical protein
MAKQKPMSTHAEPATAAADTVSEADRLRAQYDEKREASDPRLFDRVRAYHPHAATSDEAFAAFSADYDRMAAEVEKQAEAAKG